MQSTLVTTAQASAAAPKTTLYVGGLEGEEYLRQSVALAQAWASTPSRRVTLEVCAQADHFSLVAPLEDPQSALIQRMLRTIRA